MRTLTPYGIFESYSFYLLMAANVLVFLLDIPGIDYTLITLVAVNLLMYSILVNDHYMFKYDSDELIITNTCNPFFTRTYRMSSIKKIEYDYFNGVGHGVRIFTAGSKAAFACARSKDDLEAMVEEIEKLIQESRLNK